MSNNDHLKAKSLDILGQIIIALKSFEGNFQKKFNFSKLSQYFHLTERETHYFLQFLLEMQDNIKDLGRIFSDYELLMKREMGVIYLTTKRIYQKVPEKINLNREHADWLSDLIYSFQHVKKGKGFDISQNNSIMVRHLQLLMKTHPYFFENNGKKIVYPSRLASELGNMLLKGKKLNRPIEKFTIGECTIEVVQ